MIPIHGQPFLKKDPFSKAILNCNYEKLNSIKNMKELSNKYIEMEDRIDHIDKTLDDIKQLLQKITEKNN